MGQLLDALPQGGSAADVKAREVLLLKYAQEGEIVWDWAPVTHQANGHVVRILVQRDGMKLEGVRLSMSATLAQQIADIIGAVLPTARINDLVEHYAAIKVPSISHSDWVTAGTMATVPNMVTQSELVDQHIGGEAGGVVGNIGKQWVITNGLLKATSGCGPGWPALAVGQVACNYGFYVPSGSSAGETFGLRVIQSPGRCHDRTHADYSQVQFLCQFACELDGDPADIRDVLTSPDPDINSLLSHEGALQTTRQPGVPPPSGGSPPVAQNPGGATVTVNESSTGKQLFMAGVFAAAATVGTILTQRAWAAATRARERRVAT